MNNTLVLDLYLAFNDLRSDHFSAQLFRLINKADSCNRHKIFMGFPDHVAVYEEWYNSSDENDFFTKYLGDFYNRRKDKTV